LAIPLAVLIGVPVYINGLAAVPFVAGLIQLGMSPPAGLAFMLATTATGFAAMTAVWAGMARAVRKTRSPSRFKTRENRHR